MKRLVLVAPDSFKGTLTAGKVAAALAAGAERAGWSADPAALADGGEGTAEALAAGMSGKPVTASVRDPLGREVEATYWVLGDGSAVLDAAEASGLDHLRGQRLEPLRASTYGTGELIAAASRSAHTVLVGLGGSATTDGGAGAIEAIHAAGGLGPASLVCLCDVRTPWESAAEVFAPQKGASEAEVGELAERLANLAADLPRDPTGVPGSGAAGGLAGGLWASFGAQLRPGSAYVCDALGIDARIAAADRVIGGEGRLDRTTLEGKALAELGRRCADAGRGLDAVVGADESSPADRDALGIERVIEAGDETRIADAARRLLSA